MSLAVGREKRMLKSDVGFNTNYIIAAFDLSAVGKIAPSRHGIAVIRRRFRRRRGARRQMAPTAQAPLPAFGSSVAFIGTFATVPSESRLCWDDNRCADKYQRIQMATPRIS